MPSTAAPSPFSEVNIGPITLRNRFIKAATNEGMAKGGIVSKGLARFHEKVAEGGAALSTVAYCATSLDGRTFVDQAVLDDESLPDFRVLTDAVHKHGGAASAQITHAGSFTFLDHATLKTARPLRTSPLYDLLPPERVDAVLARLRGASTVLQFTRRPQGLARDGALWIGATEQRRCGTEAELIALASEGGSDALPA